MRSFLPVALTLLGTPLAAQSLLYRSPNLGGTWTPDGGVVQFNFAHRFYVFPAPSHAVVNYPSFTLAAGIGRSLAVRSEEHTSELQSLAYLVCRLLLEKKKKNKLQPAQRAISA